MTAGNASGINDAAAAVVLMERGAAEQAGARPLARLIGHSYAAVDPAYMGIGPVPAVRSVMDKTGLSIADMDVIELNEAFAAQALAVIKELGLPPDKTNTNGSGISLGHPIGATGAIITVKAMYELHRTGGCGLERVRHLPHRRVREQGTHPPRPTAVVQLRDPPA